MDKRLRQRKCEEAAEMRMQGKSLQSIGEKLSVSKTTVWRMLRTFAPESFTEFTNEVEDMSKTSKSGLSESREQQLMNENARLKAELSEARRERDLQNLRADVLDEMITIAERKFDISIRKKHGVKR